MADPKKGRGCFFYGCLSVVVIVLLLVVAAFVAYSLAKKAFVNQTSPTGVVIAPIKLPVREGEEAMTRVENFGKDLQEGKAVKPLVITSDELDYYLRSTTGGAPFHDRMHFAITNNRVEATFSFPLGAMMPGMKVNGFLNGKADFKVNVRDGALVADIDSMEVNGKPPAGWLAKMEKNFKYEPDASDKTGRLFRNLDSVEIEDDKLILIPKGAAGATPTTNSPPKTETTK